MVEARNASWRPVRTYTWSAMGRARRMRSIQFSVSCLNFSQRLVSPRWPHIQGARLMKQCHRSTNMVVNSINLLALMARCNRV